MVHFNRMNKVNILVIFLLLNKSFLKPLEANLLVALDNTGLWFTGILQMCLITDTSLNTNFIFSVIILKPYANWLEKKLLSIPVQNCSQLLCLLWLYQLNNCK